MTLFQSLHQLHWLPLSARGVALEESKPFDRRDQIRALAATWGPWASLKLAVVCGSAASKLRNSIRAVSGALLSCSGLEDAL